MKYFQIFLFEWKHLGRTPFKWVALVSYLVAAAYSLHFGETLRNKQLSVLRSLEQKQEEMVAKVLKWYAEGKSVLTTVLGWTFVLLFGPIECAFYGHQGAI